MSRLLALEWDDAEARVVVATPRGGRVVAEQAFTVALDPENSEPEKVGQAIAAELAHRRLGRVECLVALGRSSIELKNLQLPPAPDDELPDLVRFQAMRDFNTLGESWPLDYLPLSVAPDEPRSVLAAAISPELVGDVQKTCQTAGLEPSHLVLRACAAASLLRRAEKATLLQARLLVDMLADETDLTILSGDHVVYLRTARLGHADESGDPWRPLLMEIRRTLAAVSNRLSGQRVQSVHICGDEATYRELLVRIKSELDLPAFVLNPFSAVEVAAPLRQALPADPGRFTPLLGMLVDEAAGERHAIDFLHPRRRAEVRHARAPWVVAAATAAAVALLATFWYLSESHELDIAIARLQQESLELTKSNKDGDPVLKNAAEIEKWLAGDIVWIDELQEVSREMPDNKQVVLSAVTLTALKNGGGEITLDGFANSVDTINSLGTLFRDESHFVKPKVSEEAKTRPKFGWKFTSVVDVVAQAASDYQKRWKTATPAATAKATTPSATTPSTTTPAASGLCAEAPPTAAGSRTRGS